MFFPLRGKEKKNLPPLFFSFLMWKDPILSTGIVLHSFVY